MATTSGDPGASWQETTFGRSHDADVLFHTDPVFFLEVNLKL
jgi:hypothetical protein